MRKNTHHPSHTLTSLFRKNHDDNTPTKTLLRIHHTVLMNTNSTVPSNANDAVMKTTPVRFNKDGSLDLSETPAHMVEISRANGNSPLLRLPAELRIHIWEEVFSDVTVHIDQPTCYYYIVRYRSTVENHFEIPHLCRQIYAETAHMSFALTNFRVHCESKEYNRVLKRFKGHLKEWQKENVGKVTVILDELKDEWRISSYL